MLKTLVGLVLFVVIGVLRALYSRWVLSPRAENFRYPLVLAFCTKIGLTLGYALTILVARFSPRLKRVLYGSEKYSLKTHWRRWTTYIVPLIVLSVLALSLDTLAYTLVDLSTKNVIDASLPLPIMLFKPCAGFLFIAQNFQIVEELIQTVPATVKMTYRRETGILFQMFQKGSVLVIVVGTAMAIWHVKTVSWLGVVIDASTLFPVAWSTFIIKALLGQDGWTYFMLLAVTALPETFLMAGVVYAVHGKEAFALEVFRQGFVFAGPVLAMAILLSLLGFLILQNTSELSYTIAGNVITGSVILIDLFYIKDRDEPSLINWIGFAIFVCSLTAYAFSLWWTRSREMSFVQTKAALGIRIKEFKIDSYYSSSDSEDIFLNT